MVYATCHPDRQHAGRGLCQRCYQLWWKRTHIDKVRERGRRWYHTHKDQMRAISSAWKKRNPDRQRQYRHFWWIRKYGITPEEYQLKLVAQGNTCAICRASNPGPRCRFFAVDHDHNSGRIRGLLCNKCNRVLGLAGDSVIWLREAIAYLELYQ